MIDPDSHKKLSEEIARRIAEDRRLLDELREEIRPLRDQVRRIQPRSINTTIEGNTLTLTGMVASLDGQQMVKDSISGAATEAEALGIQLAHNLRQQGATEILEAIFTEIQRGS
ncbi:hypothetical protein [Leptolyngbya sp. 7M]|uniref:hypothetical protein n=1 Tax=Leptolyngbya sp. 7M TaxID=2812896 RepID=UPI001B8C0450|nr:hypothetical protein [Leptolyngbya sp. 7M]QYO63345.1 hypothetical protein JVX88_25995 [Leptolyngbya sp. 7M]